MIVAALTIGAALPSAVSAAPLGGLSQAAPSLQTPSATKAEPVYYYYYRRYGYYRPYYYYRPRVYYRPYRRFYWRY